MKPRMCCAVLPLPGLVNLHVVPFSVIVSRLGGQFAGSSGRIMGVMATRVNWLAARLEMSWGGPLGSSLTGVYCLK